MSNLIGISGLKGSGKDEVAKVIWEEGIPPIDPLRLFRSPLPSKWQIRKFAQKLKEAVALLYGCKLEQLEDQNFKENMYYHFKTGEIASFKEIHDRGNQWTVNNADKLSEGIERKKSNIWTNFRVILQHFGTEVGRNMLGENFWVTSTFSNYTPKSHWILSDMRFPNELQTIVERGGLTIKVIRPGVQKIDNHPSETALLDYKLWDEIIINDGSLDDLRNKVKAIVQKYNL